MPIDPSVLLLGLPQQARVPYDAPDVVEERRLRVQQLRDAAKAKQDAQYEQQLYDWAIKSNLGPDGTPDIEGVRKSLYSVAPQKALKFDDALSKARKQTAEEKDAVLKGKVTSTDLVARVLHGATADNWNQVLPAIRSIDPDAAAVLPAQFDQKAVDAAIQSGLTNNEFVTQKREALKFHAEGHVLKGIAAEVAAYPGELTAEQANEAMQNALDHGASPADVTTVRNMPTAQLKPWADNLLKGPTGLATEADRAAGREQAARTAAAGIAEHAQTAEETHRHNVELEKAAQARAKRPVGGGAAGAAGGLTPDAVDYVATQYRILGPSGMPTRISEADRTAVLNKSAEQVKLLGQSPAIAVQRQAAYKSDATSLTKMRSMAAAAESFETKANQQADIVNELSGKVGRIGSPMLNSWLLAGKKEVAGDTDTALLYNAIQTFSTEYAKIMEGSTGSAAGSSDSARRASENLIKATMGKSTIPAVVALMQREMALTRTGYDATIEHITNRMGGTVPPEAGSGTTVPATVQGLLASQPPGKYTLSDGTVWQKTAAGTVTQVK